MHEPEELVMGLRAISAYMDLQKNEAAGQVYCLTRSFFTISDGKTVCIEMEFL